MKTALLLSSAAVIATLAGSPVVAAPIDDLIAAAKAEGELTVIALPHDWCGYGDLIAGLRSDLAQQTTQPHYSPRSRAV